MAEPSSAPGFPEADMASSGPGRSSRDDSEQEPVGKNPMDGLARCELS